MISVCGCNFSQIVCAAGPVLFYIEVKDGKLVQAADTTLEHEVACIDITPLNEEDKKSEILSIGLWTDITVRLFKLPSLEQIAKESLGGGKKKSQEEKHRLNLSPFNCRNHSQINFDDQVRRNELFVVCVG